jgi:glycosyltransferase involved in cell wall biosynthesis
MSTSRSARAARIVLSNASTLWGGVHVITEILALELQKRGHDVLVLCRPDSRLEARLRGIVPLAPILKGMDFHPRALLAVVSTLRRFRPDVIMTMTKKDVRLTGPVARLLDVPVVVRHANDRGLRRGIYHRLLYGWLPVSHVANSHATRATLLASAHWLDPDRVRVIHNGVNTAQFTCAAAQLELPAGSTAFGFFGRFDERKGVLDLAAAWPIVRSSVPGAQLVMVGTGALEDVLHHRFDSMPDVHWLGHRRDVPALMKAVDCVLVPSHWEGFGLVAAEAMAAGRPVIAANASSLPEIVRDGVDGILIEPAAPDALARAMIRLARDPAQRARMGAAGAERAGSVFSQERMVDAYEDLLVLTAGASAGSSSARRPRTRSTR